MIHHDDSPNRHINRTGFLSVVVLTLLCPRLSANSNDVFYSVEIDGISFEVAEGYTLTKIADSSITSRPVVGCWDDQHNLVICESAGVHQTTKQQLETKPHQLSRLTDADGDGNFDTKTIVAKDLSFYSGVLCIGNDAYVSTPPSILKLSDSDGDGVYEERTVWHDGGTITGCGQ